MRNKKDAKETDEKETQSRGEKIELQWLADSSIILMIISRYTEN